MRWLLVLVVLCLAGPASAQENDAEKLYRAMEKKLRAAKSLHVAFDGEQKRDAEIETLKGKIDFAQGNKARFEAEVNISGKSQRVLAVSDGKVTYGKEGDKAASVEPNRNAPLDQKLPGMLARGGVVFVLNSFDLGISDPFDLDKQLPIKNMKLGVKENVGKRSAQAVEYEFREGGDRMWKASVWIDTQTQLPLKRLLVQVLVQGTYRFTETYSAFTVDGKVDPKLFEIPK
jgi:outer membrane lipoprotein-sorting protein